MMRSRTHFQQAPPVGHGVHTPAIESEVHRPFPLVDTAAKGGGAGLASVLGGMAGGSGGGRGGGGSGGVYERHGIVGGVEARLRGLGLL